MIDFRYHLVSLISVFLALAVGIVLGAGPLRENLGSQLTGQVEQLRTEKDGLRADNESLTSQNDELGAFISRTGPDLVSGTLHGRSTAVVYDDDSVKSPADSVSSLLDEAGADTPVSVKLQGSLWDPSQGRSRAEALTELEKIDGSVVAGAKKGADSNAEALTTVTGTLLTDGSLGAGKRERMWAVLTDARLFAVDGSTRASVDSVVMASAAPDDLAVAGDDSKTSSERTRLLLQSQTGLLQALVDTSIPTVVSGSTPTNDDSAGLLRTVRGDSRFKGVSSGDRLQSPDGPTIAVLALADQVRGTTGSYGTASDAQDRVPEVPGGSGGGDDGGKDTGGNGGGEG